MGSAAGVPPLEPAPSSARGPPPALETEHQTVLGRILQEFRQCCGLSTPGAAVCSADLVRHWSYQLEAEQHHAGSCPLSDMDRQAMAVRASQVVQEMDLTGTGTVSAHEWVHYVLMRQVRLPSLEVPAQVDAPLRAALRQRPGLLGDLQGIFRSADVRSEGSLVPEGIAAAYGRKLWHFCPSCPHGMLSNQELDSWDPEALARDAMTAMDLDGSDRVSYVEFMVYCVGRRKQDVTLHFYDLTKGVAAALSPWILGEHLEGLWHTGVQVFGKEYYFGGDILHDTPMATGFGEPLKHVSLGFTLWRQEELHEFIVDELRPLFNRKDYDAVFNNCNHFADRLCLWLTGRHLPPEVVHQSASLMRLPTVRVLRPLLNRWLGNLGRDTATTCREDTIRRGAAGAGVRSRLEPGTLVSIFLAERDGRPVRGAVCAPPPLGDDWPAGRRAPATEDLVWVRFLALVPCSATCNGQAALRTECMPRERVTPYRLDGFASEALYRSALRALSPPAPRVLPFVIAPSGALTTKGSGSASTGLKPIMSQPPGSMSADDSPLVSPPSTPRPLQRESSTEEPDTSSTASRVSTAFPEDFAVPTEARLCLESQRHSSAGVTRKVGRQPRAGDLCGRFRSRVSPERQAIVNL